MAFGKVFQLHTFGESHGKAIGGIIQGCPSNIPIDMAQIQSQLDRRKPGQSKLTSPRKESDTVQILSGIFEGKTLGTPIGFIIPNKDANSNAYKSFKSTYRPSHADYTYDAKYGHRDWRGGGRSSARETACRVVGGAIAQQILEYVTNIKIMAWVSQVENISTQMSWRNFSEECIESSLIRCPDKDASAKMIQVIEQARVDKDTVGGVITCVCQNIPAGLGEPVFHKLEAELAGAMLSLPASKGFEIGSGFKGTTMRGSTHNDPFSIVKDAVVTESNNSGGIQGGISNGMEIFFNVAFKPVSTIFQAQKTITNTIEQTIINPRGRHDPCVLPRAVPIVEAMAYLVLCDQYLLQQRNKIHQQLQ